MFIGLFQLGDWLPLHHQVLSGGVAADPGSTPTAKIYTAAGALTVTIQMAAIRPEVETGLFTGRWQITTAGRQMVVYSEGADAVRNVECFDTEGGDARGAVISAFPVRRPEGESIFFETDAGSVYQGLGPY